ncbi:AAC(3) family N-acetyltransferase [Desulfovibrio sp.]|uniref:AAC(3) family N-acetyltransferase n=2 Tax=Desulfovibrio sp. TaxID=885 RepID=UPI0025BF3185|nr:AAC(3) family N-acetyltransferase [Desulfovibrio sp.]
MDSALFHSARGVVTSSQMQASLRSVAAADCDVLYIHTDMTFGLPVIRRSQLLAELLNVIESLGVRTLIFPTFTFSFCNNEPFDVQNSRTSMGALNEYVRKSGRGARSSEPLLSVYVLGDRLDLIDNLSEESIGVGSNYDRLHHCGKNVKFLFFGADMRQCFTYTHYMEAIIGVPYRYNREFSGTFIDGGVFQKGRKAFLYSTYANCRLNPRPVVYDAMQKRGQLQIESIGNGIFCCFSEKDAHTTISELLYSDELCLTDGNFDPTINDTAYNVNRERIVSVR